MIERREYHIGLVFIEEILKEKMFPYFQPIIFDAAILLLSAVKIGAL